MVKINSFVWQINNFLIFFYSIENRTQHNNETNHKIAISIKNLRFKWPNKERQDDNEN